MIICTTDNIKIYILDKYLFEDDTSFDIVYEDKNILVVNKPKNIEVTGENSLTEMLLKKCPDTDLKPCHRLDRNTKRTCTFC